jgi:hypothetical protein
VLGGSRSLLWGALLALCLGCAGNKNATRNRTFYDWSLGDGTRAFEKEYPPLDWPKNQPQSYYMGVSVLDGGVRFSRPRNWRVRAASSRPGEPYIHYVSPNAYSFAIYQRRDPPHDHWKDILMRYEADVKATGAHIIGWDAEGTPIGGVPVATAWGQGRAFSVEREVEASKAPLQSHSREMLLRSNKRVVLVQIVYQEHDLAAVDKELLHVLETLEVR